MRYLRWWPTRARAGERPVLDEAAVQVEHERRRQDGDDDSGGAPEQQP